MNITYHILGDRAVLIRFPQEIKPETLNVVNACMDTIQSLHLKGITQVLPSYCDVTVFYDPFVISLKKLLTKLKKIKIDDLSGSTKESRLVHIPVCYDISLGLDIEHVAEHHQLNIDRVIEKHTSNPYLVYMLGFTPGFAYLGGLDPELATPRKQNPRKLIPAGSVGIAGSQTGIYPINSPGGWQIIGQTPLMMFDVNRSPEVFLQSGDHILFDAINLQEFNEVKEAAQNNTYQPITEIYQPE